MCVPKKFIKIKIFLTFEKKKKDFPDGKITRKQFKNILNGLTVKGDATKFFDHIFRAYDDDQNNFIDSTEFIIGKYKFYICCLIEKGTNEQAT